MPYYFRVLSRSASAVEPRLLVQAVRRFGAEVRGDVGSRSWRELEVVDAEGETLLVIERDEVHQGSLGQEEIAEFSEEVAGCLPTSGAEWLLSYLPSVRTIYAIQVLDGGLGDILNITKEAIWNAAGGIIQADREGFSNEDGYHILWQFGDTASGDWWMALRRGVGWEKFMIDLANEAHRRAFKRGEIPPGVERTD